jgi:hypothetical protein
VLSLGASRTDPASITLGRRQAIATESLRISLEKVSCSVSGDLLPGQPAFCIEDSVSCQYFEVETSFFRISVLLAVATQKPDFHPEILGERKTLAAKTDVHTFNPKNPGGKND